MIELVLRRVYQRTVTWAGQFCQRPDWAARLALGCVLLSLLTGFPSYHRFAGPTEPFWEVLSRQIDHPFTLQHHPAHTHEAKIAFRLLPPLLGKLSPFASPNGRVAFLYAVQHLLGGFFFYLIARLMARVSQDAVFAVLFTLGLAFVYVGKAFFYEVYGLFDGMAYFFIAWALFLRNPWLAFLVLQGAFWTDERGVLAAALVLLWHRWQRGETSLTSLLRPDALNAAFGLSLLLYGGLRWELGRRFGLAVPLGGEADAGLAVVRGNLLFGLLAIVLTFEVYWLYLLAGFGQLLAQRQFAFAGLLTAALGVQLLVSLSVLDITRSLAYAFPAVVWGAGVLGRSEDGAFLRKTTFVLVALAVFIPTCKYVDGGFYWTVPLPLKLLMLGR